MIDDRQGAHLVWEPSASYDPDVHHRRSLRLKDYDYALAGAYVITICTHGRVPVFGDMQDGQVMLSAAGQMVETVWHELPSVYEAVGTDVHVVMPNHLHGIVLLAVSSGRRLSLPDVIHRFKSLTAARYRRGAREGRWLTCSGRLWQRNYYEHIVRDDDDLRHARDYIVNNPARWAEDVYQA